MNNYYKVVISRFSVTGKEKLANNNDKTFDLSKAQKLMLDETIRTILVVNRLGKPIFWAKRLSPESEWIIEQ